MRSKRDNISKLQTVATSLPLHMVRRIDDRAAAAGVTRAAMLRELVREALGAPDEDARITDVGAVVTAEDVHRLVGRTFRRGTMLRQVRRVADVVSMPSGMRFKVWLAIPGMRTTLNPLDSRDFLAWAKQAVDITDEYNEEYEAARQILRGEGSLTKARDIL